MGVPLQNGPREVRRIVVGRGCWSHSWLLQLNEAHEQYSKLEERMEYIRSLHELTRNHFGLFSAEMEALDILVRRPFRESSSPPGTPHPHRQPT